MRYRKLFAWLLLLLTLPQLGGCFLAVAGVAVGAASVEPTMWLHPVSELSPADFAPAFIVVSVISTISVYFFFELPADAGHQVSGRGVIAITSPERDAEPEETAASETVNAAWPSISTHGGFSDLADRGQTGP